MNKLNGKLDNFQESVRLYYVAIARHKQDKTESNIDAVRDAHKEIQRHGEQYENAAREQGLKSHDIMKALDAAEERGLEESRK